MSNFIYTHSTPYLIVSSGSRLEICKGDMIKTVYADEQDWHCVTGDGRSFLVSKEDIKKYFQRPFDYEQEKYFNELRDKTAVAAMQGLMINAYDSLLIASKRLNMSLEKCTAKKAVMFADALVEELKATV